MNAFLLVGEVMDYVKRVLFIIMVMGAIPLNLIALEPGTDKTVQQGDSVFERRHTQSPAEGFRAVDKNQGQVIFDFINPSDFDQWRPVNDTVMGGISASRMEMAGKAVMRFTGTVSLENNGGFASLQSRPSQYDLSGCQSISLRVKGDGKRYKFSVKTSAYLDAVRYEAAFSTEKDQWTTVTIPLASLKPTYRGTLLTNEPPLDSATIKSFSFLISDRQEGAFSLEIDWIKAYPG